MTCNKTCNVEKCKCADSAMDYFKFLALTILVVAVSVFLVQGCELTINYNGDPMASAGFEIPDDVTVTWKDR